MKDKIVKTLKQIDMTELRMPLITVYGTNQIEYPGKYVARIFDADKPTNTVIVTDDLDKPRDCIEESMPGELTGAFLSHGADDDPSLIGCYI